MRLSLERIKCLTPAALLAASIGSGACKRIIEDMRTRIIGAATELTATPNAEKSCIDRQKAKSLFAHEPVMTYMALINECQKSHDRGNRNREVYCIASDLIHSPDTRELANTRQCEQIVHASEDENAAFHPKLNERYCYLERPVCKSPGSENLH